MENAPIGLDSYSVELDSADELLEALPYVEAIYLQVTWVYEGCTSEGIDWAQAGKQDVLDFIEYACKMDAQISAVLYPSEGVLYLKQV